MAKIIITEAQLRTIKTHINENGMFQALIEKMKRDLDLNYESMTGVVRQGGEYMDKPMIKIKADEEVITPKALYEYFLYKYKLSKDFTKQVITDWIFGRIVDNKLTKNVSLS